MDEFEIDLFGRRLFPAWCFMSCSFMAIYPDEFCEETLQQGNMMMSTNSWQEKLHWMRFSLSRTLATRDKIFIKLEWNVDTFRMLRENTRSHVIGWQTWTYFRTIDHGKASWVSRDSATCVNTADRSWGWVRVKKQLVSVQLETVHVPRNCES